MSVCYIDCTPFTRALITPALMALLPGLAVHEDPEDEAVLIARLRGVKVALNGHTAMPARVLASCPDLRSIVFLGSGASSYVDMAEAAARGIAVRTIAGYGDRAVAEHAMALMLGAARRLAAMDRALRAGSWDPLEGVELAGKRLGVIGLGGIGRCFAGLAAGFGMEVVGWNRSPVAEMPLLPLAEVLESADVVSLHLALTAETRGFLGAAELARMKPGAILVNTARGALVDEAALLAGLAAGRPGHAALDVFAEEPLPRHHPFTRLANVTLSAHAGFKTPEASRRLIARGFELAARDLAGL